MKVDISAILTVLTILAIVGGGLSWVLGKFLTDKKDKMTLSFEIERIKQMLSELKDETDKIDPIQRQLDIISEQIKHL